MAMMGLSKYNWLSQCILNVLPEPISELLE